jgi:hypothetical protein
VVVLRLANQLLEAFCAQLARQVEDRALGGRHRDTAVHRDFARVEAAPRLKTVRRYAGLIDAESVRSERLHFGTGGATSGDVAPA